MPPRLHIPTLLLGALIPQAACVDVNGGAVELSWDIRETSGDSCDCDEAGIDTVQLVCADITDPTIPCTRASVLRPWPCTDGTGATRFEIPEGDWQLFIDVTCRPGASCLPRVPDPIVRTIESGRVAELNALLILVDSC